MPICELTPSETRACCAVCGTERTLSINDLALGQSDPVDEGAMPVLALPPCGQCRAQEFLPGASPESPDHPDPGGYGHLHRLLVDQLHLQVAKVRGKKGKPGKPKTRDVSEETLKRWFPKGLKLAPLEALAEPPPQRREE